MSIAIYTYSNPYHLSDEPYWEEIKACPYFCASQTLVNGLRTLYRESFQQGRVTTLQNLIKVMFQDWENPATIIKQHAVLDHIITHGMDQDLSYQARQNLVSAFIFNREDVFNSIRILFELNVNPNDILIDKLTPEQKLIIEIYQTILDSNTIREFTLSNLLSERKIDEAINDALPTDNSSCNASNIPKDRVVIHGVHQFTPIMLRTIEQLSQYKKVILLFNYQFQYATAYQTWIDIYTAFDSPIHSYSTPEFTPSLEYKQSFQSNLLADSLGKMINGTLQGIKKHSTMEILEFDNVTEFASYVASQYYVAMEIDAQNPLHAMREQIYAADSSVNSILKMYFPEQFGERQFLNYPLGHFFIAIANMWDSQLNKVYIRNFNDICECFRAGILSEETPGELSSIYNRVTALFEGCIDIKQMIARLKKVQRTRKSLYSPETTESVSHIAYYDIDVGEIEKLVHALTELDELSTFFYEDFEKTAHNFRDYYRKLRTYIQDQTINTEQLGEEYADILRRVLIRLEEAETIDASASFECLKATMNIYLTQETKPGKSANWIVRDFEQIDGDILRSQQHPDAATYHFACLTDEDINAVKRSEFTWPLDADFFEVAQEPVDWKYQVYVKSRKEYKNFKQYALLYGLEFNRSKVKLSYVKRDNDKIQSLYSLLKILGLKVIPYKSQHNGVDDPDSSKISVKGTPVGEFDEFDLYRYRICRYRFLNESILEGSTVYKDSFLLGKYLEVWLENIVKVELEGMPISEVILINKLNDAFDEIKRYFPFVQNVSRIDVINTVRNRLISGKNKSMPRLTSEQLRDMKIRELFIHQTLSDAKTQRNNIFTDKFLPASNETVASKLAGEKLTGTEYLKEPDIWCQYCSNRDICVASYALDSIKEA